LLTQTARESPKFTIDCVLANGSTQLQTLEAAVRGPLMPKIDGVNNLGE
jgi:hypothetical protein